MQNNIPSYIDILKETIKELEFNYEDYILMCEFINLYKEYDYHNLKWFNEDSEKKYEELKRLFKKLIKYNVTSSDNIMFILNRGNIVLYNINNNHSKNHTFEDYIKFKIHKYNTKIARK